tara:strand:+ start:492 stop:713 length:222 start_codon:yes stop_codon:yes gene_type:complete
MEGSSVLAKHGWDYLREDLESLDYLALNAQGFGRSNILKLKYSEGMLHGIARVVTQLIRLVEGYHDGVPLSND